MTITYGHPKDGRWDLKQFVLGMATEQTKKQNQKPTLKWVFFRFRGVRELRFRARDEAVTVMVTNMTPELGKILRLLGRDYVNYYV